jgi:hypothetical protein
MATEHKRAVGIFANRPVTASALQALMDAGFSMRDVSVIARDANHQSAIAGVDVQDNVSNHADTGGAVGAVTGGVLGGITGLLVGLGTIAIPGVGAAVLAGEAAAVLTTLVGGAAGAAAGGLLGALIGMGIPEDRARHYSDRVARGEYLVMLKGTDSEILRAEQILRHQGIQDWGVYSAPSSHPPSNAANGHDDFERPSSTSHLQGHNRYYSGEAQPPDPGVGVPGVYPSGPYVGHNEYSHPQPTVAPTPINEYDTHTMRQEPYSAEDEFLHRPATSPSGGLPLNETQPPASGFEKRAIGIFPDRSTLEQALDALRALNFPMHNLSIAVREEDQQGLMSDRQSYSSSGHGLDRAAGMLTGFSRTHIPGLGSILMIGSENSALANTMQHSHADSMIGILRSLGIPEDQATLYARHLANGAYLITLRGTHQEALQAASTLGQYGMRDWGVYDIRSVTQF